MEKDFTLAVLVTVNQGESHLKWGEVVKYNVFINYGRFEGMKTRPITRSLLYSRAHDTCSRFVKA